MLVLSRKTGESIVVGDDIIITFLESKGEKIKVGIVAPSSVKVYRKELYDEIKEANLEASRLKNVDTESLKKITFPPSRINP